jgi:hypothetical protein
VRYLNDLRVGGMGPDRSDLQPAAGPRRESGLALIEMPVAGAYDSRVFEVTHREFVPLGSAGDRASGRLRPVLNDINQLPPKGRIDEGL